jgi:hypothetical protein
MGRFSRNLFRKLTDVGFSDRLEAKVLQRPRQRDLAILVL